MVHSRGGFNSPDSPPRISPATHGISTDCWSYRSTLHPITGPRRSGCFTPTTGGVGSRPNVPATNRALGIPENTLSVQNDKLIVTHHGDPGDAYFLVLSFAEATTPLYVPPYGFVYVDALTASIIESGGVIGLNGTGRDTYPIPPGLQGQTFYVLGLQFFYTKPGTGSFSIFETWVVP